MKPASQSMMGLEVQKRCPICGASALLQPMLSHFPGHELCLLLRYSPLLARGVLCFSGFHWVSLGLTPRLRNATLLEMFCIHAADPLRVCQATWTLAAPSNWSYLHNSMWGSRTLCITHPHGETLFSCTYNRALMEISKGCSWKQAHRHPVWTLQNLTSLSSLRLDPPKLSCPNKNFLLFVFPQEMSFPVALLTLYWAAFH